jgi:O-antigen ligase
MNRISYDKIYLVAWLLCVVTLPLTIPLNRWATILLFVIWLAEFNFAEKWNRLKVAPWVWPFIAFLLMHVIGLIYSEDRSQGLFEIEKKISFLILPLIAACGRSIPLPHFNILKKGFIYSCFFVVVASLLLTVYNLLNHSAGMPQNFDPYTSEQLYLLNPGASSTWEYFSYIQLGNWIDIHPAYFSMYLIFCIVLVVQEMVVDQKTNFSSLVAIILFTLFIGLLSSRMAIISFVALLAFITFYYVLKTKNYKVIFLTGSIVLILGAWIIFNPVSRFRLIQEPIHTSFKIDQDKKDWNSVDYRLLEWEASINELGKSWLTGVGTGDGQTALQVFYSDFTPGDYALTYNAHNQYLQTMLELGVVGLFLLVICIFKPIFLSTPLHSGHIAFVLLFGLMCFTESVLARQKGIVFFTMFQSLFYRYAYA